jgi:hypothetical protein
MPETGSDWQKEPFWISPDLIRLPEVMNSGTCSENTPILQVFPKNTADYRFKMYANRRFWEAKPEVYGGVARSWGKEGLFWGWVGYAGFQGPGFVNNGTGYEKA